MPITIVSQSGAIPWRLGADGVEIFMITSRLTGEWQVPKGSVEEHLGPVESAAQEAWEEAGLRGEIDPEPAGSYRYEKRGWVHEVTLYPLRVLEVLEEFLEAGERSLAWVPLAEAPGRTRNEGLAQVLIGFRPWG